MRRLLVLLPLVFAIGCNRAPTVVVVAPPAPAPAADTKPADGSSAPAAGPTPQEKQEAAVWRAVSLLADRKLPEALAAFEEAQKARDTEQVRDEIARLKLRLEAQAAAERAATDVRGLLDAGQVEEAARLAAAALARFGDGEASEGIAVLKRQADALTTAPLDRAVQLVRFRQEAESAARDNNLRAALVAYEQALAVGGDDTLRRDAADIRIRLTKYDDARRRAAELRRDAAHLDDALAAYREAATVWDTLQVRQEIDDCTLALQSRRDRLAVADFETRGDVGLPLAGKTVAEELMPAFKGRYDLAERDQLARVLDELRLSAADLVASENGRTEFAKLAKVRYLVVGSVTPLAGVTVHARLVDVRTGLVVQTAKVAAPTVEAVLPLLPQLAAMLQMSDEERLAQEQQLARQAAPPSVIDVPVVPPPPVFVPQAPPPPPVVIVTPRPPDLGGVVIDDFQRLPPVVAPGGAGVTIAISLDKDHRARQRALAVALELGDNLFRRGRFQEAHAQFQLALGLSPGHADVLVRLDRCRPHLPPPPVVPPSIVIRPRMVVLDFVALGGPDRVPPGLGPWTAEHLAPYLCPPYDVADRGELYWYMGRLGLTLRDVVIDPLARLYLGRAMNARFFVLGTLRGAPAGLDVAAHLLDAETGARLGTADLRVTNQYELKLRLADLAHWLLLDPRDRVRIQTDVDRAQALLLQAQQAAGQSNFTIALNLATEAGRLRPGSVQVQVLLQQYDRRARQAELEAARRADHDRRLALAAEAQRRQFEMSRAAEAARASAQQVGAAERQQRQDRAYATLLVQARAARDAENFTQAAQLFDSALGIQRRDDVAAEQAAVRARADEQARTRAAEETAARERALRERREAELARLRTEVDKDRRRREAEELTRRNAQEQADKREYTRLLEEAQRLRAQGRHDPAVHALQAAKRLRPTEEADRLLTQALVDQARANAQKQGGKAKADLEEKLAAEKAAREKADAETKRAQEQYAEVLRLANTAMQQRDYDGAVTHYQSAAKLYRSDAVLAGLRDAQAAQAREKQEKTRADADRRKQADAQRPSAEVVSLLRTANDALAAEKFDAAIVAFQKAKAIAPTHAEVLAGLTKAEQARSDKLAAERKRMEEQANKDGIFRKLMDDARKNFEAKQHGPAVVALEEALKLKPGDSAATALLKQARDGSTTAVAAAAAAKQKADEAKQAARTKAEFDRVMKVGRDALAAQKFDDAIQAFTSAKQLMPNDTDAARQLMYAQDTKIKVQAEQKRKGDYTRQMTAGKSAFAAKKYDEAQQAFTEALKVQPNDADATRLLKQAQDAAKPPPPPPPPPVAKTTPRIDPKVPPKGEPKVTPKAEPKAPPKTGEPKAPPKSPEKSSPKPQDPKSQPKAPDSKTPPKAPAPNYAQQMQAGAAFERQQRYADAAKAYREALKAKPGDAPATRRVEYAEHMDEGTQLLRQNKKPEAARKFEAALKAAPSDAAATRALEQARRR